MLRENIRKNAVEMYKNNVITMLEFATGVGKTRTAIDCLSTSQSPKVLVVVAETLHKAVWKEEFIKWGYADNNVTTICYASLKKCIDIDWDVIILDEAHHITSEKRMLIFRELHYNKMLMLSATMPPSLIQLAKVVQPIIGRYTITLEQAIEYNILPKPEVILVPITLDNVKVNRVHTYKRGSATKAQQYTCYYKDRFIYLSNKSKYPNLVLNVKCTAKEMYTILNDTVEYLKTLYYGSLTAPTKNAWMAAGLKRKKFLGELKYDITRKLISTHLANKRYICFCSSVKQAKELGKKNAIHSTNPKTMGVLKKFNNKEIDNIYAVGMLQEGHNLVDIDAGVIIQLDGQVRSFIQKFGRTIRGTHPLQYIIYVKDTQDEVYLKNVTNNINKEFIYTLEIN